MIKDLVKRLEAGEITQSDLKKWSKDIITLRELWAIKATDYFHAARKKRTGQPTKTLEQCYREAQEDFGPDELMEYSDRLVRHWYTIVCSPKTVVWADGTQDYQRVCSECASYDCTMPVHAERYRTPTKRVKENEQE